MMNKVIINEEEKEIVSNNLVLVKGNLFEPEWQLEWGVEFPIHPQLLPTTRKLFVTHLLISEDTLLRLCCCGSAIRNWILRRGHQGHLRRRPRARHLV